MKLLFSQIDKANHFIVGYLIYFLSSLIFNNWVSLMPVILIAFAKEYFDKAFDWKDFIFTIAGAIPIFLIRII